MKIVIRIVLWVVIGVLGYFTYQAVYGPVEFNKIRDRRYIDVVERMKDIRDLQLAHRDIEGNYGDNFDDLLKFVDTAQFVITQRRDTTFLDEEYREIYGVDKYKEDVVIDTLSFASVKDSIFGSSDRYKNIMYIPHTDNIKFEMSAGYIVENENKIPVFEVKASKDVILADQDIDLVVQEKQIKSVDGVDGAFIQVGSMKQVNTNGNWPKNFGDN
ncbi:hypothetical protein P700755_002912 [Psychroflexus torquis ATCC 700755]|uniref:Uncharacterized protein n=1 Tax=Psychroflexus torquis (strain ATCC 700755 / CIP 106069 / ACAM 623) TaxID=313595 RepID=K4IVY1_PSYTT|nr:hypothetical protein [Psychroflexus torquis]AFU69615.1 hypothetical protein P700755_002912 [Psychroflexus torquis ATCC 700755]